MEKVLFTARKTIRNYTKGGNILIAATILAMIVVNIPFTAEIYNSLWNNEIALQIGKFNLFSHHGHPMTIMQFINDALMAIFFLNVGLEIKREILVGELSSFRQAILPIVAAIGGMLLPVGLFFALGHGSDYINGAAIPMATDIAFSLGVLAMLGKRVPLALKVFLTTLAVVDDIGGILVIAIFYSSEINVTMLLIAAALFAVLLLGSFFKIKSKIYYLGIGAFIWFCFLNAGIHPTIAGVLIAFCVPAKPLHTPNHYINIIQAKISHFKKDMAVNFKERTFLTKQQVNWFKEIESASDKVISPLQDLEDSLHPIVNYIIVPLFAFANAGIFFGDLEIASIFQGVSLTIMISLVVGKFLGIFSFSWLCVKLKIASMPAGTDWKMIAGVSLLGGIGFTVSLFIANLSFTGDAASVAILNNAKLGIVVGSLIAGILGYILLAATLPKGKAK